ncbi:putative 1-phosphatidylinositol-3-phosphate 5-kinase chromatin regulator PHD family [Helianthus annuus]|nr:putative 1-phosphatidylinositol-3-phosphate 5-kinase chromatin regulator PHD family [Helianthus annuus]KAJ0638305.1 putative 1-phosphatidylinositol-3-phosphate 5-kinase chromatin regulator PHD family [Helianthus annuus]KAJ0755747.1 putative 1-phosphatidylinositol-3-phosphate 5-kinase chromatin regulator PHD family [Helianthus annuus]KAJ0759527.1 putative 1-phosphatidylinositol-3-phosphate 5-kinase chromatin regulator PHD family [Helianthus annuus]
MDATDNPLSDLLGALKSWGVPRRQSDPVNVSRDFWMPDQSCRVCYDCDSQFTLFNRRHHCRFCGRVFCAKCTQNFVPAPSSSVVREESGKIRVCNYCFKQWKQGGLADQEVQDSNLDLSTSPSAASYISTKSSGTADSSCITFTSAVSSFQQHPNHCQSLVMESNLDEHNSVATKNDEQQVDAGNHSPTRSEFGMNRGDDLEDDFAYSRHLSQADNAYYDELHLDDYGSRKVHPDGVAADASSSSLQNSFEKKEDEHDVGDECEASSSSLYAAQDINSEPVDFENNGELWLPPEPEDEEDEKDALLFDDDENEDGDGVGEWGYGNMGSGEFRNRDRSNEEHKKAMKNVVDGHFRALVSQLLQAENLAVNEDEKDNWLEIITSLSWEAASLLKPDTSKGGGMDPGGYVKIKCLAAGRPSDSMVVKGVVCKKNVAHRRMTSRIEKPRFLILGGALEYQRVSNLLSSFDTLLQQEMDHLRMAVAKIDAHQPDVLLVEKSVSRYAQEYLLAKDISLVLNIKRPLLERIARCTGAQIVPSIDHLSSQKLGYCDMFHVEKFVEEHGSAGQNGKKLVKTLMYFEGCPKPFGCTILLRGASGDELKKVKHVVQYGVFAAYHLALETSFLADEGASLPELPLNSPLTVALPEKASTIDRSISTIPGFTLSMNDAEPSSRSNSLPMSDVFSSIMNQKSQTMLLPLVESNTRKFQNKPLTSVLDSSTPMSDGSDATKDSSEAVTTNGDLVKSSPISDDMEHIDHFLDGKNGGGGGSKEEFPPTPSDHQSILVSLSSRCVWKGTVCERSHLFRIKYYGNFDKPLGRFLRDNLFDQGYRCPSCEMPSEAHVQCYTHRQGTLTISVKKLTGLPLPGEKDGKIWMWHRCLKCPRVNGLLPSTRRIVMSDAAWGLSFGKFLELSFSNHAAASRVANCGHSLHRDCLRFYGFGKMVACFRYASINVHSVYLPPSKLVFKFENQEWIQTEVNEVVSRAELLFSEILNALTQISEKKFGKMSSHNNTNMSQSRRHIAELEEMLQKEKTEFEESLEKILNQKDQGIIDIFEINRLRRQLVFQSYVWDHRLVYAASASSNGPRGDLDNVKSENVDKVNGLLPDSDVGETTDTKQIQSEVTLDSSPKEENSSDTGVHRVVSEGQLSVMASLSDTLDAAWTGNLPGSDLNDTDDKGDHAEDHHTPSSLPSPTPSTKGSESVEDSSSWFSMPFLNFYRSLNRNLLPSSQKLEALNDYKPVYIRESELQGGARLLLSVGINDIVVPVYDDEPTSIISYVLLSHDYVTQMSDELKDGESIFSSQSADSAMFQSFSSFDDATLESVKSGGDESLLLSMSGSRGSLALDPLSYTKALHARVEFSDDGKVKYSVTCYYAKRFEALRRLCCPSEMDYIRSLSRCKKWGAQGGKSNVFFAKTLDDRFIIKQVTKTELESFIKFAPAYFKYISESIGTGSPTCLAKILGIYQVTKQMKGGKEMKMDVLVMENLLFGRNLSRLYDLKGSSRSRYNPDSSGSNKVLLDQNLIEAMPTSPIFVGNKAKRLLERAVWNDTAFLASIDVMDYSLLVGVDEEKHELVLGIIDFMRQYTWDKHLETWVKASGILGGPKAPPTVISPKQYKKRFRKAMTTYFLMVPDQWSPPAVVPTKSQADLSEAGNE